MEKDNKEKLTWIDLINQIALLKDENDKLKEEVKQLTERLQISEAYRFCDNPKTIFR